MISPHACRKCGTRLDDVAPARRVCATASGCLGPERSPASPARASGRGCPPHAVIAKRDTASAIVERVAHLISTAWLWPSPRSRPSTSGGDIDIMPQTKAVVPPAGATWPRLVAVPVEAVGREAGMGAVHHQEAPHHLSCLLAGDQFCVSFADIDAKRASSHRDLAARPDELRRGPGDTRALRGMTCTGRRGCRTRFGGVPAASADQQRNEHDRKRDTPKRKHLALTTGVAMLSDALARPTLRRWVSTPGGGQVRVPIRAWRCARDLQCVHRGCAPHRVTSAVVARAHDGATQIVLSIDRHQPAQACERVAPRSWRELPEPGGTVTVSRPQ